MPNLALTVTLLTAAVGAAPDLDRPAGFELTLEPIPSLRAAPPERGVLLASVVQGELREPAGEPPAPQGPDRRASGAMLLAMGGLALAGSFLVMPLADTLEPDASPNQGAMVLRLELLVLGVGALGLGAYFHATSSPSPR